MTNIAEEIKDRLDIVDYIGRHVRLDKAGRNFKGLCPFHAEKTPSFIVWPGSQSWHCFGACNTGGDLFDFVQMRDKLDFGDALRQLARDAGITLTANPEATARWEATRAQQEILTSAARHYRACLQASPEALNYAHSRGWTDDTIKQAGLGYFDGDWNAVRVALAGAGVDPQAPAAQAVLKMPPKLLVYPHVQRGRVTYLAGRGLVEKRHWNLPQDLVGAKQPYYNHAWQTGASSVVVVEGQADAITLAQWGIPAIALAGCGIPKTGAQDRPAPGDNRDTSGPALITALARCATVAIGLDADPAGSDAIDDLAAALLHAGVTATRIRIIRWPEKDANDWLKAGARAEDANALLQAAPTWLHELIGQAAVIDDEYTRDAAIYQVFNVLPALTTLELARWTDPIMGSLALTRDTFETLLRAARREAGLNDNGRPQYAVLAGRLVHRTLDQHGNEKVNPLCNFTAHIQADIVEDDGERQERRFLVAGRHAGGHNLPPIEIEAGEFAQMNWPLIKWGASAAVSAGNSSKDHLRVAILTTSRNIEKRYEYSHLGWRKVDDGSGSRIIYLSANGAIGMDGVQVRLLQDLAAYRLPLVAQDPKAAMQASLRFLATGDHAMTIPLWAAVYLAPLSSVISPSFTIWLFGTTGSLKSTATALAMCHFGKFAYNTPPASWTGTANALELKAFLCKDSLLWVDDFVTQSTIAGTNELKAKADQLLRDWGNRAGRSRMTAELKLRRTFVPRGLVLSTAEQLPPGQSILSRLFAVEATPTMMTRGQGSPLSQAQQDDAPRYPHAMTGYLTWLAGQYDQLTADLPEKLFRYTEAARSEGAHLRMPANVATMFLGAETGLAYALAIGAIDQPAAAELRQAAWATLLELAAKQNAMVIEEKPVELYLSAIEQMLATGTAHLRHRDTPDNPDAVWPQARTVTSEFLGWYDDYYFYLIPKVAFGAVWRFYRASGVVFPDTERGVREKLLEQKLLFPQADSKADRYTYRLSVKGDAPRVLRIARPQDPKEGTDNAQNGQPDANQEESS